MGPLRLAQVPVDVAPPGAVTVVVSGLLALFLTVVLSRVVELLSTMAHEGGHALAAVVFGIPIRSVEVHRDGTGSTEFHGSLGMLSTIPVGMAGYLGPPAFGLLGAVALTHGRADVVLWGSLVLLVVLLAFTDNWFGRFAVALTAGTILAVAYRHSPALHLWTACTWTWLLLMTGFRTAVQHRSGGDDFAKLHGITLIPASFWGLLSLVGSFVAVVVGGMIMLGQITVGS
jgi:hypothetical protein